MSPQTAHNWDGEKVADGVLGAADALLEVDGSFLEVTVIRVCDGLLALLLLLIVEVLLLFRQLGELEAELEALGIVLPMYK